MKKKLYYFNLIEIVLTVAVISFGVVVILGMLPKGMKATKNATVESYSAEVMDQMANFMYYEGADGISRTAFNTDLDDLDNDISNNYALLADYIPIGKVLKDPVTSYFEKTNTPGVFTVKGQENVYVIVMGDSETIETGEQQRRLDFSGMLQVWKEEITGKRLEISHSGNDGDGTSCTTTLHDCRHENATCDLEDIWKDEDEPKTKIYRVCMELSYPLSLKYEDRTKRYYSFEVMK